MAAHSGWAQTDDRTARTANGREAFLAKFEHQVDPDGKLAPAERARRAESARKAWYAGLALKSSIARRKAKEAAATLAEVDEALATEVA